MSRISAYLLLLIALLPFYSSKTVSSVEKRKVFISYKNGKFTLLRNGEPFLIRGGSGYTHLATLAASGGNTIRVWDTTNLRQILDDAAANHLDGNAAPDAFR